MNQTNPADDPSDTELYQLLQTHDWNTSCTAVSTDGVIVTFRKHYTSDFPGMEARNVVGKDRADAATEQNLFRIADLTPMNPPTGDDLLSALPVRRAQQRGYRAVR